MKYYEMHESVYQRIKNEGKLSWDKSASFEEMWSHETNIYLQKNIDQLNLTFKGMSILDLGTGTGTSALYAAKKGAEVVGVEFSKTAIDIAKANALALNLEIEFQVGNVLALDLEKKFDVVVDSTVLHCIVGDEDRAKFYEIAKNHLKNDGHLFINTMISEGDMSEVFPKEHFYFEDNVLWSLGVKEITERKVIDGKSYFPHRTLLTREKQLEEFASHGFETVHMEISPSSDVKCMVGFLKLKN
jgi:2-polyprenyl-3-methyl-5-hydroxy-6-metoxy-1,4-benzoquinol methylase